MMTRMLLFGIILFQEEGERACLPQSSLIRTTDCVSESMTESVWHMRLPILCANSDYELQRVSEHDCVSGQD
jgi:hypothetical protein